VYPARKKALAINAPESADLDIGPAEASSASTRASSDIDSGRDSGCDSGCDPAFGSIASGRKAKITHNRIMESGEWKMENGELTGMRAFPGGLHDGNQQLD
jgi:hypothetical protein